MLYHTPLFICILFALYRSQKGLRVDVAKFSAAGCSVHPVPFCACSCKITLCPTLGDIPGWQLTLYDATRTYREAFAGGCRWLSADVSRSAGRIFVFITRALAGCNDCFYLFSWQSRIVWFFRRLLRMLTSVTSVIFLLVFHLVEIRLCAEGYASRNCLHYQM